METHHTSSVGLLAAQASFIPRDVCCVFELFVPFS